MPVRLTLQHHIVLKKTVHLQNVACAATCLTQQQASLGLVTNTEVKCCSIEIYHDCARPGIYTTIIITLLWWSWNQVMMNHLQFGFNNRSTQVSIIITAVLKFGLPLSSLIPLLSCKSSLVLCTQWNLSWSLFMRVLSFRKVWLMKLHLLAFITTWHDMFLRWCQDFFV